MVFALENVSCELVVCENKVTSLVNGKYEKILEINKYTDGNRIAENNGKIYTINGERRDCDKFYSN